jgi:hypothetical protein
VFDADGEVVAPRFVDDSQLSPLDLTIAPNGNLVVSSEWPFGATDAISSVREYDSTSGRLVRSFRPDESIGFHNPRGLRFSPDGNLCCVARDQVVSFDFEIGNYAGTIVNLLPRRPQGTLSAALLPTRSSATGKAELPEASGSSSTHRPL